MDRGGRVKENKRKTVKEMELELHSSKKETQERKSERRVNYGGEQKPK